MKKQIATITASSLLLLLAACGDTSTEEVNAELEQETEQEQVELEEDKAEVSEEATDEETQEVESNIEDVNQNIADDDMVKIDLVNVEKINDEIFGESIKVNFDVENKSDKKLIIQAQDLSIDGYMADDIASMSIEVMPGKKAQDSLTIDSAFLDEGQEMPQLNESLEATINLVDDETYETINTYDMNIQF
jgi:hypothetical protein